LEVTLNLRCQGRKYEGQPGTPVGTYLVKDGRVSSGQVRLELAAGADSVTVDAQFAAGILRGRFASGQDSGPVELRGTGDSKQAASSEWSTLSQEQWRTDLKFLAQELPKRHANAFHHISREQLDAEVASLDHQLAQLDGDEIYAGLEHIANSIGDAHTYVQFPPDAANFPIEIGRFGAEYHVLSVGPELEKALGAQVLNIRGMPIAQARDLSLALTPAGETTALADARISGFLTRGITLHGLGLTPSSGSTQYTLANSQGQEFTIEVRALPTDAEVNWVSLVKDAPWSRAKPGEDFWFTLFARHPYGLLQFSRLSSAQGERGCAFSGNQAAERQPVGH